MPGRVRFVCILHSHQPVGNFEKVIEEAYQKSYLPFAQVFAEFPEVPLTNHFSGCLLEWMEARHPEYFELLRGQTSRPAHAPHESWEMIGGGFYEPIMTMLPSRDRIGQTVLMQAYLERHFGRKPRGAWLTERVWEPALVKDLADAGVEYLTLDDNHFRAAGLRDEELTGGYITEDEGRTLRAFPASEKLRYMLPYARVEDALGYLRTLCPAEGERLVIYADDGEKFGVWPNTFKHVYQDGWLKNWLGALKAAQIEGWMVCSTLAAAHDALQPVGRVYLPENSYREMTEWALPARTLATYEHTVHAVKDDPRLRDILPLVKGGNWRNFRVKYAEGGRMYGKMMEVSAKVAALNTDSKLTDKARTHVFRGQCNCPYWHGVFGGMYLPHLRSAVYRELIEAEKLADERAGSFQVGEARDFDFDGQDEWKLANEKLALYFHAARGGHLYEFDLREVAFNVGDTFSRRYEAYHDKVANAVVGTHEAAQSIHDLVLAKEAGLSELLKYDTYLRESLVDHVSQERLQPKHFLSGNPPSDPGFRQAAYTGALLSGSVRKQRAQSRAVGVTLSRTAHWAEHAIEVRKEIRFVGRSAFNVDYRVTNLSQQPLRGFFTVEMNYSLLAGDAHDRYYALEGTAQAGRLALVKDFGAQPWVSLNDHWLNVALKLASSVPAQVLVSPVKTVSQSEGGFEAVYQSSCVALQWELNVPVGKGFEVTLTQDVGKAH